MTMEKLILVVIYLENK